MYRLLVIGVFGLAVAVGLYFLLGSVPVAGAARPDPANVAYTLVLLAMVSAALMVNWQGRFMTALRYAGIWLILGVALLVVYAYRNDANAVLNKVVGAVLPSRPISADGGFETIRIAPDGHFYIRADVRGRPVEFLVDTGATTVVLDGESARAIGIDLDSLTFDRQFQTANGVVLGASVRLEVIRIGSIVRYDVPAAVVLKAGKPLLGMSYFNTLSYYSVKGDELALKD